MALSGKKITELEPTSSVTLQSVLPIVEIGQTEVADAATKVTVEQLQSKVLQPAQLKKVVITSSDTEAYIENVTANTIYKFEEPLTSLEIENAETSYSESLIYFTTADENFTFIIGIPLLGDDIVNVLSKNTSYVIHIKDGYASIEGLSNRPTIEDIEETSGSIKLMENTAYSMTIDGATEFMLPNVDTSDNLNQILLQLRIDDDTTIDWGTENYFNEEPSTEIGDYDVIWEFDKFRQVWFVGQVKKVVEEPQK